MYKNGPKFGGKHARSASPGETMAKEYRFVWPFSKGEISEDGTYTGEKRRVYKSIISDSFKVDVTAGHKLNLCAHRKPESDSQVFAHFKLVGKGKETDCTCGACGYRWEFAEDECDSKCES